MGITVLNVCISPLYHSMERKVLVGFWHRVKDPLVPRQPSKCLLTSHCVGIRVLEFHSFWTIQFPAPLVFMVLDMKCVSDFLHVQPHMAEVPRNGSGLLATFKLFRWHMLSYDKMIFLLDSLDSAANADSIQTSTIRKTCAGPSDLEKHQTKKDYARCLDGINGRMHVLI